MLFNERISILVSEFLLTKDVCRGHFQTLHSEGYSIIIENERKVLSLGTYKINDCCNEYTKFNDFIRDFQPFQKVLSFVGFKKHLTNSCLIIKQAT